MKFKIPDVDDPMRFPKSARRSLAQKQEAIWKAHREHIERLRPLLPPALQQLNDFSLDDGVLHSVRVDPEKRTLQLRIGAGDLQRGYFTMVLDYFDITLTAQEITLLGLLAKTGRPETGMWEDIAWGELEIVDREDDSCGYIHRILWRCITLCSSEESALVEPEIELRFGDFAIEWIPAKGLFDSKGEQPICVVWNRNEAEDRLLAELLADEKMPGR